MNAGPLVSSPFVETVEVRRSVSGGAVWMILDRHGGVRSDCDLAKPAGYVGTGAATTAMTVVVEVRHSLKGVAVSKLPDDLSTPAVRSKSVARWGGGAV